MAHTRIPKPIKTKSGRTILPIPLVEGETMAERKREVKRWGEAFGRSALSDEVRWQVALGDYQVLFRENNPRAKPQKYESGKDGSWGIYLRVHNIQVATFADNSDHLRATLSWMFDAAHTSKETARWLAKRIGRSAR